MLRKFLSIAIVLTMVVSMFCGCATKVANVEQKAEDVNKEVLNEMEIKPIYRSPFELAERHATAEYFENKEITDGNYDKSLAVKCTNGTFVGQVEENGHIKTWRGIPFAKIPGRFERSVMPDPSDKVMEAYHFGRVCPQEPSISEPASLYEQGEYDCLNLAICTGNNDIKNKPVFVYVHGGAYANGGSQDTGYDARNFAYYNPDILVVNITYRVGVYGNMNLGIKDENGNYLLKDYEENADKFNTSTGNLLLDQVQALRWIKENIEAFGGDNNNITLAGESAGGGSVSNLLMSACDPNIPLISTDEGLFHKVFSMSGGINQYSKPEELEPLLRALMKDFNVDTIKGLQEIDEVKFADWWRKNAFHYAKLLILDGVVLPKDPYKSYLTNVKDQVTVLQGCTTNEYNYFEAVFADAYKNMGITHEDCAKVTYKALTEPTETYPNLNITPAFKEALEKYLKELENEGYVTEKEKQNQFLNDHALQITNYYMAAKQAENGGTTYIYAFDEPYNGRYAHTKASHAVDCYYLFGTFNNDIAKGTKKQVDFSIRYQNCVANFCKTGNPSTEDIKWEKYDKENKYCALLNSDKMECIKNFRADRIDNMIKMVDENDAMKFFLPWNTMFKLAQDLHK